MWLFTRYGFYSISAKGKVFAVRARYEKHLQNLIKRFPQLADADILNSDYTDYRFRIMVPRKVWARKILPQLAEEQTWSSFKDEALNFNEEGDQYAESLHAVWKLMRGLQEFPNYDIDDFEYSPFMNGEPPEEEVFEDMRARGVKPEELRNEDDRKRYTAWLTTAPNGDTE